MATPYRLVATVGLLVAFVTLTSGLFAEETQDSPLYAMTLKTALDRMEAPDSLALDVKLSAPTVRKALRTLAELGFAVDAGAGRYALASPRTSPEPVVSPPPEPVELPSTAPSPPASAPVDWVQTSFA